MRFCCALEDDQAALFRFATAAFEAYFGEARNLDEPAVLVEVANACGLDGDGRVSAPVVFQAACLVAPLGRPAAPFWGLARIAAPGFAALMRAD